MKLQIAYAREVEKTPPPVVEEPKEIYPPGLYALVQEDIVCEFSENPFSVTSSMKWIPVDKDHLDPDGINLLDQADKWEYKDGQVVKKEDNREKVIFHIKQRVAGKLATTDWMVIREMETGKPMPEEFKEYRQKLREYNDIFVDYETTPFPKSPTAIEHE
tara:strand:+ start:1190 stop:1669 length:480 start_codon:yes stop_codon:yes gene_type:complete